MFNRFPHLTFIIHHSQHKIAIYHLRKVDLRVEVTDLIDHLSILLIYSSVALIINWAVLLFTVHHSLHPGAIYRLQQAIFVTSAQDVNQKPRPTRRRAAETDLQLAAVATPIQQVQTLAQGV